VFERKMPFVLGPVNKNNEKIRKLFGDQGGHWKKKVPFLLKKLEHFRNTNFIWCYI